MSASPVCVSKRARRHKRTEAATPSASRACWEVCATAFSTVWRSRGVRSEAWARVSPKPRKRWKHWCEALIQFKELKSHGVVRRFGWLTFEGTQHCLKVGVSNQRGGRLEAESFFKPIQQSGGNFHCETIAPLGEHGHGVHQGALVN